MSDVSILMILGMHRSGTSATAGVFAKLGISVPGKMMLPTSSNPKGYFENSEVFLSHERFFQEINSSWDDPLPSDVIVCSKEAEVLESDIEELVFRRYQSEQVFIVKDPRLSIVMPVWLKAAANAGRAIKCLHVFRHPLAVIASLAARDGIDFNHGLLLWLKYTLQAERYSRPLQRSFVYFDDLVSDWRAATAPVIRHLDLGDNLLQNFTSCDVDEFIDHDLRHHRGLKNWSGCDAGLRDLCEVAITALKLLKEDSSAAKTLGMLDECHSKLVSCAGIFGSYLKALRRKQIENARAADEEISLLYQENKSLRHKLEAEGAEKKGLESSSGHREDRDLIETAATRSAAFSWQAALQDRRRKEEIEAFRLLLEQSKEQLKDAKKTISFLRAQTGI